MKSGEKRTVVLTSKTGDEKYVWEVEVVESAANMYGNNTATIIHFDNGERRLIDTRYYRGTIDDLIISEANTEDYRVQIIREV